MIKNNKSGQTAHSIVFYYVHNHLNWEKTSRSAYKNEIKISYLGEQRVQEISCCLFTVLKNILKTKGIKLQSLKLFLDYGNLLKQI